MDRHLFLTFAMPVVKGLMFVQNETGRVQRTIASCRALFITSK